MGEVPWLAALALCCQVPAWTVACVEVQEVVAAVWSGWGVVGLWGLPGDPWCRSWMMTNG